MQESAAARHTRHDIRPLHLMLAIGNQCIGAETNPDYDARGMIKLLLAGFAHEDRPAAGLE